MTRLDLHVHTLGSDGVSSPAEIVAAVKAAKLDGMVITDHHNTYTRGGNRVARALREAGFRVFRGCEYSAKEGHVLVIGVAVEHLNLGLYPAIQTVIDKVQAAGGVAIPAHPFHGYRAKLGEGLYQLRGLKVVEVRNGQQEVRTPWENDEAFKASRSMGLKTTGGSDAHYAKYIGACFTRFNDDIRTEAQLVKALLRGRYSAMTAPWIVQDLRGELASVREKLKLEFWDVFEDGLDSNGKSGHIGGNESDIISKEEVAKAFEVAKESDQNTRFTNTYYSDPRSRKPTLN